MSNPLLMIDEERIRELLDSPGIERLGRLADRDVIGVSACCLPDIHGNDEPQYLATIDMLASAQTLGFPVIIMLDSRSDASAAGVLRSLGAIVLPVVHNADDKFSESGLLRPYVTAGRVIDSARPYAVMLKFESGKNIFADPTNIDRMISAVELGADVICCRRSMETLASLPAEQRATESLLYTALSTIVGSYRSSVGTSGLLVPHDATSGVIAMDFFARRELYRSTYTQWQYLLELPFLFNRKFGSSTSLAAMSDVASVEINFSYHPAVVAQEEGNPAFALKRLQQMRLMANFAVELAGGTGNLSTPQRQILARLDILLEHLAQDWNVDLG